MRVLIIGCGYVGTTLGERLAGDHEVSGVVRTASISKRLFESGIRPLIADITCRSDVERLPREFDWIIDCVSSSRGGPSAYRAVFLEGTRFLIEHFRNGPVRRFIFTSSTSVYGQIDGSEIDEYSATEPQSETSRILLEGEDLVLNAAARYGFPALVLRPSGIYGPGRGFLFQRFLRNEAFIEGDGSRWLNMIHRDDLAESMIRAFDSGRPGRVYNATDDEPVTQKQFYRWLADTLDRPLPPVGAVREAPKRKRAVTSKRISNDRLRSELKCRLSYPSFREGYSAEINRLLDEKNPLLFSND